MSAFCRSWLPAISLTAGLGLVLAGGSGTARAGNPITVGQGMCDPAVRVFGDKLYMYATHDASPDSKHFKMCDWNVWTSSNLVDWTKAGAIRPEDTYYGKPWDQCWATDAISKDGKFFFYFSRGPKEIGVVTSDTPVGPWKDPLGKPLIPPGLTPTEERDPAIFQATDGATYIVFGTFDYYIARLGDDLISLAETPRPLTVTNAMGPYGAGKLDDKPYLHARDGRYYLSWGCYYAMADNVYGPYAYKGCLITAEHTAPEFQRGLTMDRHGSFFEWRGKWYFACNDQSFPGSTPHFRNTLLSEVHYRPNGEIEPLELTRQGVSATD